MAPLTLTSQQIKIVKQAFWYAVYSFGAPENFIIFQKFTVWG